MAESTEPVGDVSDTSTLDPESLGFMCGIEFTNNWQQGSYLQDTLVNYTMFQSTQFLMTGQDSQEDSLQQEVKAEKLTLRLNSRPKGIDPFVYVMSPNSGLIELDQRPPLPHDKDAMDISLTVSAMLKSKPLDLMQTIEKP